VSPGQHLPPDHSKGNESTVGGYAAVHSRPAALEGRDGFSYTLEILSDATGEKARPFGAYLLFVQWSRMGAQRADGHVESAFLTFGSSAAAVEYELTALPLADAQRILDTLLRDRDGASGRRWLSVIEDESDDGSEGMA
jgi:hypothetical protein